MRHASRYAVDTQALMALYLPDHHSAGMQRWRADTVGPLRIHRLLLAEWDNACAAAVFRGVRTPDEIRIASKDLEEDLTKNRLFHDDPPWRQVFDLCRDLSLTHGPILGTRTLDTLHVACAIAGKAKALVTYDHRCAALAQAAGLAVEQP
jgi:predicted nucleic acid-binding protein